MDTKATKTNGEHNKTNLEVDKTNNLEHNKRKRETLFGVLLLVFVNILTTVLLAFFANFGYSLSFLSLFSLLDSFRFYICLLFVINVAILFRIGLYGDDIDGEGNSLLVILGVYGFVFWSVVQLGIFGDGRISIESKSNEIVKEYSAIYQEQKDKKVLTETVIEKLEKIKNGITDKEKRDEIENKINEYKSSIGEE